MNVPTPAIAKKQNDARKAREAELASQLQSASQTKQLPSTEDPSSKKSVKRGSATSRSQRTNRHRAGSNQSETSKSNHSTKSTRTNTTSPADGRKVPISTSTTPRKNSSTESTSSAQPKSKREFVRPDHLTQKPLRDNEDLLGLKKSLENPARGQFKREYRTNGRQSGKSKGLQNKKENN